MEKKLSLVLLIFLSAAAIAQNVKKPFQPSDFYKIPTVKDPDVSPDKQWIAYSVAEIDSAKDKRIAHIWMQSWDGKQSLQLTHGDEPASKPKWSPDGKYLAFLSSRESKDTTQLWLMDRRGGEGRKLTNVKGDLDDYSWAPDGRKVVLVMQDPEEKLKEPAKTAKPIVIDRYHFKQDVEGYLEHRRKHLYLFDVITQKLDTLTTGDFDDSSPEWSPDGKVIAFVSNRSTDPDKNENTDIFLVEAKAKGIVKKLTNWGGHDNRPKWSPDGKKIAYLRQNTESYTMYDLNILCVMDADGTNIVLASAPLNRPAAAPEWSPDGKRINFLVEDDMERYVASYNLQSKKIETILRGRFNVDGITAQTNGSFVLEYGTPYMPFELYALQAGKLRRLTYHHKQWLDKVKLAAVKPFKSVSKDGTSVSGLLFTPDSLPGKKMPFILYIHGGPVSQDDYSFDATRQILASAGYAVAAVNYRGSSGRGIDYTKVINADWGNREVMDLQGAVDELVKQGIADPERLGVGGWSYGGILTDFMIATDTRFKAAASGAGSALQVANYGIDQYILQYDNELGQPWKNIEAYNKISYPFLHADRIKTPVLFMSGLKDFNVPTAGSEHMYQALKSLGVPAELVLYPGQNHGIGKPSYQVDREVRYIKWFDKYLKQ